jgi:hypothetical protein
MKLKREQQDEGSRQHPQQIRNEYAPPIKVGRGRIKEAPQGMKNPHFPKELYNCVYSIYFYLESLLFFLATFCYDDIVSS